MEGETTGELPDWEVLCRSEAPFPAKTSESLSGNSENLEVIGADSDSDGIIWSNYFSLDNQERYSKTGEECDVSEECSVELDNPSWIDPGLARPEIFKTQASFGEMTGENGNFCQLDSDDGKYSDFNRKFERVNLIDVDEIRTLDSEEAGDLAKEPEMRVDSGEDNRRSASEEEEREEEEDEEEEAKAEDEERKVTWWKAPLEVLKYCVFKVSPVWSFSVAAAVMGILILGRRLHKLKQKSQSLHLNLTVDDKKLPQFMNGAARLNQAFSVVRRVPMVRPPLPAAVAGGRLNTWPAMSMR